MEPEVGTGWGRRPFHSGWSARAPRGGDTVSGKSQVGAGGRPSRGTRGRPVSQGTAGAKALGQTRGRPAAVRPEGSTRQSRPGWGPGGFEWVRAGTPLRYQQVPSGYSADNRLCGPGRSGALGQEATQRSRTAWEKGWDSGGICSRIVRRGSSRVRAGQRQGRRRGMLGGEAGAAPGGDKRLTCRGRLNGGGECAAGDTALAQDGPPGNVRKGNVFSQARPIGPVAHRPPWSPPGGLQTPARKRDGEQGLDEQLAGRSHQRGRPGGQCPQTSPGATWQSQRWGSGDRAAG